VRLTPQFLRALHLELFTKPSLWRLFYEFINLEGFVKSLIMRLFFVIPSGQAKCDPESGIFKAL